MIIRQLTLENFGVYRGEQIFDLAPQPLNGYNRPIVLLRGKNGAGKTTLIAAIRLCLHGSLALGSRISRADYEHYLVKCIHVPSDSDLFTNSARITLVMDYVGEGRKKTYKIERAWQVVEARVKETLQVWENDVPLPDLHTKEEIESFLRELILPGVADLFFFDGEKLHTLEQSATISETLADTIKTLLGLHLVEQLQRDLDFYVSRQQSEGDEDSLHRALADAAQTASQLEDRRGILIAKQAQVAGEIVQKQEEIARQNQQIASQGHWFTERVESLQASRQRLGAEIEVQRRQAQELANGLLPFAISPQLTAAVAQRLQLEAAYETAAAAQTALSQQLDHLAGALSGPEIWSRAGLSTDEEARATMMDEISGILRQAAPPPVIAEKDVIHRVSGEDRQTLLRWIEQSQTDAPRAFCQAIRQLQSAEEDLAQVNREIALVPADETISPLVEALHTLNREMGALQKAENDLAEALRRLNYEIEQNNRQSERLRQQIAAQEKDHRGIQLATKTQQVLESYAQELSREKTARLATHLVQRFNLLCRKADLVDAATINAENFEITLYRRDQSIAFGQLSAGERQLLAMSLMWALREVSGAPLPVIIDTPLGRLDSDHRLSVVHNYFPRVSHQVILLATDTEVDERLLNELAPAISHAYHLEYDAAAGRTVVQEGFPFDIPVRERVEVQ